MADEILCGFLLTGLAEPDELKEMTFYSEPGLAGEVLLHFS